MEAVSQLHDGDQLQRRPHARPGQEAEAEQHRQAEWAVGAAVRGVAESQEEADTEAGEHEVDALALDEVGEQVDVYPGAEGGHQQPQDDVHLDEVILDLRIPGEYMSN